MEFTKVPSDYGTLSSPYSNNATIDAKVLIEKISALTAKGNVRYVAFVGEAHDNPYDVARREHILHLYGKGEAPGVHLIVERFEGAKGSDAFSTEPVSHASDVVLGPIKAIEKPSSGVKTGAYESKFVKSEDLTALKQEMGLSGPADWNRNQWFVDAILRAIRKGDESGKCLPILVLCGDDHEKFLTYIFETLAKPSSGFNADLTIAWVYFPPGKVRTSLHNAQVQTFVVKDNVKPAGYVRLRNDDEVLIGLEKGLLTKSTQVELRGADDVGAPCWAVFFDDQNYAESVRETIFVNRRSICTLSAMKGQRAVWTKRVASEKEKKQLEEIDS